MYAHEIIILKSESLFFRIQNLPQKPKLMQISICRKNKFVFPLFSLQLPQRYFLIFCCARQNDSYGDLDQFEFPSLVISLGINSVNAQFQTAHTFKRHTFSVKCFRFRFFEYVGIDMQTQHVNTRLRSVPIGVLKELIPRRTTNALIIQK